MSHQTISTQTKKSADFSRPKKSADFFTDFIFRFLVSFLVRIGENPLIWVSHSPTIKDYKKLFLIVLNTLNLEDIMIYNDKTLLH